MSYSPREEDAVYDYSRKEWGDVYSDHKADLVLVTTRHPGIGSDVPKGSRGTYVKEPGVEKSFSTYCRRSYEFWDKLKT